MDDASKSLIQAASLQILAALVQRSSQKADFTKLVDEANDCAILWHDKISSRLSKISENNSS